MPYFPFQKWNQNTLGPLMQFEICNDTKTPELSHWCWGAVHASYILKTIAKKFCNSIKDELVGFCHKWAVHLWRNWKWIDSVSLIITIFTLAIFRHNPANYWKDLYFTQKYYSWEHGIIRDSKGLQIPIIFYNGANEMKIPTSPLHQCKLETFRWLSRNITKQSSRIGCFWI
jgi:hypothetical protein